MHELSQLARSIIRRAIKAGTPCYIHQNAKAGVSVYAYQDKIGVRLRLALYMSNTDRDESMGLSWHYVPRDEPAYDGGAVFIEWEAVQRVRVSLQAGRWLLEIDDLVINFLEHIEDTP